MGRGKKKEKRADDHDSFGEPHTIVATLTRPNPPLSVRNTHHQRGVWRSDSTCVCPNWQRCKELHVNMSEAFPILSGSAPLAPIPMASSFGKHEVLPDALLVNHLPLS